MSAGRPKPQVNTRRPATARLYDHFLGGKDYYEVDQCLVDQLVGQGLGELLRDGALANRSFMRDASAFVARQGVRQFLDIGAGIPIEPNLHQIVQEVQPTARVVYADNDPIVLRHAEALMRGTVEGATDYILADVREPLSLLEEIDSEGILDLGLPVGLSLNALLHFVPDDRDPYGIVRALWERLAPGSYVTISHAASDLYPEAGKKITAAYAAAGIPLGGRTRDEVERFFYGLKLVGPGVVTVDRWRPPVLPELDEESAAPAEPPEPAAVYGGVGFVPAR